MAHQAAHAAAAGGKLENTSKTSLSVSTKSLEKLTAPRAIPEWAMKRSVGAKSKAKSGSDRHSTAGSTLGGTVSTHRAGLASSASLSALGHAPEVPVMEMGPQNIPVKFRHGSTVSMPKLPEAGVDFVRPFPGGLRKPVIKSSSGVLIVRETGDSLSATQRTQGSASDALTGPPTSLDREMGLSLVLDLLGEGAEEDPEVRELIELAPAPLSDPRYLRLDQGKLKLDDFDDDEFEVATPDQLVMIGRGWSPAFFEGSWRWEPVDVSAYDPASRRFSVTFSSASSRAGQTKSVTRLNLLVEGEDRVSHARRLLSALRRRERAKSDLRLRFVVTEGAGLDCAPVNDSVMQRIYNKAVGFRETYSFTTGVVLTELQQLLAHEKQLSKRVVGADLSDQDAAAAAEKAAADAQEAALAARRARALEDDDEGKSSPWAEAKEVAAPAAAKRQTVHTPQDLLEDVSSNPLLGDLLTEVVDSYDTAVKVSVFFHLLRDQPHTFPGRGSRSVLGPATSTVSLMEDSSVPGTPSELRAVHHELRLPAAPVRAQGPYLGKVTVTPISAAEAIAAACRVHPTADGRLSGFTAAQDVVASCVRFADREIIGVLNSVAAVWSEVVGNSTAFVCNPEVLGIADVSNPSGSYPLQLRAFKHALTKHMGKVTTKLVAEWPRDVVNALTDSLSGPRYDFYCQDLAKYTASDLRRVILVVQQMMRDRLRALITDSCNQWITLLKRFEPRARSPEETALAVSEREAASEDAASKCGVARPELTGTTAARAAAAAVLRAAIAEEGASAESLERARSEAEAAALQVANAQSATPALSLAAAQPNARPLAPATHSTATSFEDREAVGLALFSVKLQAVPMDAAVPASTEDADSVLPVAAASPLPLAAAIAERESAAAALVDAQAEVERLVRAGDQPDALEAANKHLEECQARAAANVSPAANRVALHPSPESIYRVFLSALAVMIAKVREVKTIEQRCMTILSLPEKPSPLLNVAVNDPTAMDMDTVLSNTRKAVRQLLRWELEPALELERRYDEYAWVLSIDPRGYGIAFMKGLLTLEEERARLEKELVGKSKVSSPAGAGSQDSGDEEDDGEEEGKSQDGKRALSDLHDLEPVCPSPERSFDEVERFHLAAAEVERISLAVENLGIAKLQCGDIRDSLATRFRQVRDELLKGMLSKMREEADDVEESFAEILDRVRQHPANEAELVDLKSYIENSTALVRSLKDKTASVHSRMERMGIGFGFSLPRRDFSMFWSLKQWPTRLTMAMEESLFYLEQERERMTTELEKQRAEFEGYIRKLEERVRTFKTYEDISVIIRVVDEAQALESSIQEALEQAEDFNRREKLFGFPATDFSAIEDIKEDFDPFLKLWVALNDFTGSRQMWLTGSFIDLEAKVVEDRVTDWVSMTTRFIRQFEDAYPGPSRVAEHLKGQTVEFRKCLPVISNLASGALKGYHWHDLAVRTKKDIVMSETLTLQELLDLGILDNLDIVEEIATVAVKEHNLDRALDSMAEEWREIAFEVKAYRDSGTYVIGGTDDIMTLLDDHLVKTQSMLGSPYITNIKTKCKDWERRLSHLQTLLDEWLKVQRTWMYLSPIFSSDDIKRQMPAESRRFEKVDAVYRKALAGTFEEPRAMSAASKEGLLGNFRKSNESLDHITKHLAEYLEVKRLYFPRFYFLANDGLLEILSQTKDPTRVQKHLNKCFEGLYKIMFRGEESGKPDDLTIIRILSEDGEAVDLVETIDPNAPANKGNVEVWLEKLMQSMRLSVKAFVKKAIDDYPKRSRVDWVLAHPAQAVLNIGQLFWTREVEKSMIDGGNAGLAQYEKKLDEQLMDIVKMVRGKLTKSQRTLLGALTVIDVHARDVVTAMVEKGVGTVTDFEWMAQLRYYWVEQPDEYERYGKDPMNLVPRIINSSKMYGYEYLGNSTRLVITPLTDRCYRTLIGAVALNYGGAPAGPAGTGKTETTKDLAKAVAIFCVVYNCSDQLRVEDMAKFFKGLAAAGAWACFDEFNRISLEVLSVVAQQVQSIISAKRQKKKTFDFWGTKLRLNPDANAFITMNPGYAGRSELPDNLKTLFRPCAMMVPDYAMIAEIKLFSFGFEYARAMAKKIVQVLKLSSEQLSSQKHYDYGMRAVFSILVRAGNLRQQLGDSWSEDLLVLSAINDVNLPKFTTNDLPLFRGITRDLFPGAELPAPDYRALLRAIRQTCKSRNLQPKDEFVRSVVQLRETVAVRHGLMVVGETGSGKTKVIHTLAEAYGKLKGTSGDFASVQVHSINPKSIKQAQLYGFTDVNTQEWTDGVLAVIFKQSSKDESPDRHWILFDGPVDAVWIEDMNTVLDDNKKLCLTSGDVIKMSSLMTMMFETEDLKEASPATVSRVGMVFMEPKRLGWRPTVQSWLHKMQAEYGEPLALPDIQAHISMLFEWLVPPLLHFIQNGPVQLTPVTNIELVASIVSMLDALFDAPFVTQDTASDAVPAAKDRIKVIEGLFIMSATWSIGSITDTKGRVKFDEFFRALLNGEVGSHPVFQDFMIKNPLYDSIYQEGGLALRAGEGDVREYDCIDPADEAEPIASLGELTPAQLRDRRAGRWAAPSLKEGTVRKSISVPPAAPGKTLFDFVLGTDKASWREWMTGVPSYSVPEGSTFNSIMVPTLDTVRNEWIMDLFIRHNCHVLAVGETGTGKSVQILEKLNQRLPEGYLPLVLNFSAQTSANQTQDIIDGKMNRRRKGVYGPPLGSRFVVFVDDLNMPAKEEYGAQPPIEILRQWMDHGGWYDRADKEKSFMQLIDIQFMAAMGPPGGGRTRITQRYVRHFNVLGFTPFAVEELTRIFVTIMSWSFNAYPTAIKGQVKTLVAGTIDMYETISAKLLPTPTKSHYTFNLRDLSKVFQGINQSNPDVLPDEKALIRLWAHECERVFHDRLINEEDRGVFHVTLGELVKTHFKKDWKAPDVRGTNKTILFGNFVNVKTRHYEECKDHDALVKAMKIFLEDYNALAGGKSMNLVLFMNAIEHVSRISRVINLPLGNALLVGVGGSGRKSLTTLAVSIAEMKLFQIEISKSYNMVEWRDDLKKVLMQAGKDGKPTVFLFSDTQIVKESFVEDINNILNNGEVPNLWESDERAMILDECNKAARKLKLSLSTPQELFGFFVDRCRANLHIVLCFSPIGEAFRRRLRMFPSLVNCCTIDWFTAWPEDALSSVAQQFLEAIDMTAETRLGVIETCVAMQTSTAKLSERYLAELRRYYYVTPTSYLELINTFKDLIGAKRTELLEKKFRYDEGLKKLAATESIVGDMQRDLTELQPQLEVASRETEATLKVVNKSKAEASKMAEAVAKDKAIVERQAEAANKLKTECETDLAEAEPILASAEAALNTITKGDIAVVKTMKTPSPGVKLTMEAVCIMMGVKPKTVSDEKGNKVKDYWEPAKKELLGDIGFLKALQTFDRDNIPPDVIEKIEAYYTNEEFVPAKVAKSSSACEGLCKWVRGMRDYDRIAKVVGPKREALKAAEAEAKEANDMLQAKLAELKEVEDRVASLEAELQANLDKKASLEQRADKCEKQLKRAHKLLDGLGGEATRWREASARLGTAYDNATGDILLSAGLVAYMGAFTMAYRKSAIEKWSSLLRSKGITCAEDFSLSATLGDPVAIRDWTIKKLPSDSFSIDNAIMMFKSKRWPLMIDPQGQANRWIRQMEASHGLHVVKQNSNTFVRTIETAIQFGQPVLLENVPEYIDPVLESVLTRQVIKTGGGLAIKVGDNVVEYDPNFKLYITSKLANPHYPPETVVKVNLLNFMATSDGLRDQMLGIVVKRLEAQLEAKREELVLEDAENQRKLKEIEDKILKMLADAGDDILEDEALINALDESKKTSNIIMEAVRAAAKYQAKISERRAKYQPVAKRASILFFCIADLASVDPMYQYSLEWFTDLFLMAIDKADTSSSDVKVVVHNLNEKFTEVLYRNVCRSLFEKDKLLFSMLLCFKILENRETAPLDAGELRFFLQGAVSLETARPNPNMGSEREWLSPKMWADLCTLALLPAFGGTVPKAKAPASGSSSHAAAPAAAPAATGPHLLDRVEKELHNFEAVFDSADPWTDLEGLFAEDARMGMFQRLCVLRCLRPDKVVRGVQTFVEHELGRQFIDPPAFNLKACFEDSSRTKPLIFVLSPGADPMSELEALAEREGKTKGMRQVSLGQGQGPTAEAYLSEGIDTGVWVCLQNCHLAESWMPTLERLCEELDPKTTADSFRLWLTAMPNPKFPVSVLQNGVKITLEPPKGMRASLVGSYNRLVSDPEAFEGCKRAREFKKLMFGLCFFHASVRERRRFGPLGWNIPYDFSDPDLFISQQQLRIFLDDDYDEVPFAALTYLVGECNYGGRVTDDKDRRLLMSMLSDFYTPSILTDSYRFSPSGQYYAPKHGPVESYLKYIQDLPFTERPEVFGLHDNADITSAIAETNEMLATALSLQPRSSGGGGKSWEETLTELAVDIASKLPELYDIEKISVLFPVRFDESMNTVLVQELIRFNRLLDVVKKSLHEVRLAIKGVVVMSADLEAMGNSMVQGRVPAMWNKVSYPSLKPLGSWVMDFARRLEYLSLWTREGKPQIFWISGFFFTQSFLTGTRQNFARKYTIPIDLLGFDFRVLSPKEGDDIHDHPADGAYNTGLFLEGCRWESDKGVLQESLPKVLYQPMPIIHMIPAKLSDIDEHAHVYECPVYKTSERRGMLSTTGHSTNFVMNCRLPMAPEHTAKHWIKAGVAMLTQLDA
jgi:dynein heavy chain, axonemal